MTKSECCDPFQRAGHTDPPPDPLILYGIEYHRYHRLVNKVKFRPCK